MHNCSLLPCIVDGVNVAIGHTAYQMNIYGSMLASLAVDGNNQTSSCTWTGNNQPWWAVDIGSQAHVATVVVTNNVQASTGITIMSPTVWHLLG